MAQEQQSGKAMPIAKNEDVEFSAIEADSADLQAQERAKQADARQQEE